MAEPTIGDETAEDPEEAPIGEVDDVTESDDEAGTGATGPQGDEASQDGVVEEAEADPSSPVGESEPVDQPHFMFASGFAFGVGMTLVLLAVVGSALETGSVTLGGLLESAFVINLLGAAVFALLIGAGLYLLSYRRNRRAVEDSVGFDDS